MRNEFSRQLNLLSREMTEMGNMCKAAIEQAMEALFSGDMDAAKNVILGEEQIDQKEKDIESPVHEASFEAAAGSLRSEDYLRRIEDDIRYGAYRRSVRRYSGNS